MTSVWPSGALFATKSAPMLPPAPGLFSTTTGWPSACCSLAAMRRAERSTGPPGAYGTTRWTGRDGQSCGKAKVLAQSASAALRVRAAALAFFDEHLFALLADRRHRDDHQQNRRGDQEGEADRLAGADEDERIAAREQHRP